jgi:hypothetical protein
MKLMLIAIIMMVVQSIIFGVAAIFMSVQVRKAYQDGLRKGALVSKDDIIHSIVGEVEAETAKRTEQKNPQSKENNEFTT